jgi:hypothetical protein
MLVPVITAAARALPLLIKIGGWALRIMRFAARWSLGLLKFVFSSQWIFSVAATTVTVVTIITLIWVPLVNEFLGLIARLGTNVLPTAAKWWIYWLWDVAQIHLLIDIWMAILWYDLVRFWVKVALQYRQAAMRAPFQRYGSRP